MYATALDKYSVSPHSFSLQSEPGESGMIREETQKRRRASKLLSFFLRNDSVKFEKEEKLEWAGSENMHVSLTVFATE